MRRVRNFVIGSLLLVVLAVIVAEVYERIQLGRAQKMIDAMRSSAVRGVAPDAELTKYSSTQHCSANGCVQTYQYAKWPVSPLARFRPAYANWPLFRDWIVTAEVRVDRGQVTSRSIEIWAQPAGKAEAVGPILQVRQPYKEYTSSFPCDPAEVNLHPGYRVRRSARRTMLVVLAKDASSALVDKAFDIRISCLSSTSDSYSLCAKEINPRVLEDSIADKDWLEAHSEASHGCASLGGGSVTN